MLLSPLYENFMAFVLFLWLFAFLHLLGYRSTLHYHKEEEEMNMSQRLRWNQGSQAFGID